MADGGEAGRSEWVRPPGQKGRPIQVAFGRQFDRMALAKGYETAEEWVFDWVVAGETIKDFCRTFPELFVVDMGGGQYYEIQAPDQMFYRWVSDKRFPGRRASYREARRLAALPRVERAESQLDELARGPGTPTSPEIALARERANFAMKLAAKDDPETYGERSSVDVRVTAHELHLEALMAKGSPALRGTSSEEPALLEAELVDEGEGEGGSDE